MSVGSYRSGGERRMLAAQRQNRIVEEVQRAGAVRVGELTQLLGVSDMTVRRDLDALARRGLLRKVHGGATARETGSVDEPGFEANATRERAAKEAIAVAAAGLVRPGSAVAVTAGTTTYALALRLTHVPDLTVVTNSLHVAEVLHTHGNNSQTVILTGGVRTPSDALVGPVAVQAIRALHVDYALMGVHGIDPVAGFTSPNLLEAETNRAMIESARQLVVVADHTKWGVVGLSAIAALDDAAVLVTDADLPAAAADTLRESVGRLVIAGPRGDAPTTGESDDGPTLGSAPAPRSPAGAITADNR
jgi:DeoR/GlpR family transcriptional regulator of sugar metabolism